MIRFTYEEHNGTVKIAGWCGGSEIEVAFDFSQLSGKGYGDYGSCHPLGATYWEASNRPLKNARKYKLCGPSGCAEPMMTYITPENNHFNVCEKWLMKLFKRFPEALWIRQVTP